MPFVGLTGGMGAGKSTALAALERLGAAVLSSDAVVHELYEGAELRDAVVGRWGRGGRAGWRGRPLGGRRARVRGRRGAGMAGGLLWPLVGARVAQPGWSRRARSHRPPRAAVVEVPLLFEAGLEGAYDATIAVIAEEQCARAGARPRARAADERAARQLSQEEKAGRATFVVRTTAREELERELSAVLGKLGEMSSGRRSASGRTRRRRRRCVILRARGVVLARRRRCWSDVATSRRNRELPLATRASSANRPPKSTSTRR